MPDEEHRSTSRLACGEGRASLLSRDKLLRVPLASRGASRDGETLARASSFHLGVSSIVCVSSWVWSLLVRNPRRHTARYPASSYTSISKIRPTALLWRRRTHAQP